MFMELPEQAPPSPFMQAVESSPLGDVLAALQEYGWGLLSVLFILLGITLIIKLWPVLTKVVAIGNAILLLPEMQREVVQIKHELYPNGGGSFRDDFNAYTTENDKRVKGLTSSLKSLHRKLDPVKEAVVYDNTLTPEEARQLTIKRPAR